MKKIDEKKKKSIKDEIYDEIYFWYITLQFTYIEIRNNVCLLLTTCVVEHLFYFPLHLILPQKIQTK